MAGLLASDYDILKRQAEKAKAKGLDYLAASYESRMAEMDKQNNYQPRSALTTQKEMRAQQDRRAAQDAINKTNASLEANGSGATVEATGDLLKKRQDLFSRMQQAGPSNLDQFKKEAGSLGITSRGFNFAANKIKPNQTTPPATAPSTAAQQGSGTGFSNWLYNKNQNGTAALIGGSPPTTPPTTPTPTPTPPATPPATPTASSPTFGGVNPNLNTNTTSVVAPWAQNISGTVNPTGGTGASESTTPMQNWFNSGGIFPIKGNTAVDRLIKSYDKQVSQNTTQTETDTNTSDEE